jgi:hypothetical protein
VWHIGISHAQRPDRAECEVIAMRERPTFQLTREDIDIWVFVGLHHPFTNNADLERTSFDSDRADFSRMQSALVFYGRFGLSRRERSFVLARWGQDSWEL